MHVPTSPLDIFQKAIYLFQKTSYSPCGTFLFRTKPIFALNACAEQQALVSTTYQVEDTFHTRSDTNVECLSLRYNPNKSYACVLVFSSFCVEWPRLPLGHIVSWTSNHATCHVYSPKAVETIVLVLNFNFAGETVVDATVILGVFLVVLDKKSELPCCFMEASSKIGKN